MISFVFLISPPIFGSKEHRATLIALLTLRPHDSVCFNVFKYGVQAVLLAKGKKRSCEKKNVGFKSNRFDLQIR